jgi:hypothetical protein
MISLNRLGWEDVMSIANSVGGTKQSGAFLVKGPVPFSSPTVRIAMLLLTCVFVALAVCGILVLGAQVYSYYERLAATCILGNTYVRLDVRGNRMRLVAASVDEPTPARFIVQHGPAVEYYRYHEVPRGALLENAVFYVERVYAGSFTLVGNAYKAPNGVVFATRFGMVPTALLFAPMSIVMFRWFRRRMLSRRGFVPIQKE